MADKPNHKNLSDRILSWVTVISLIVGGVWAGLEYRANQKTSINDKIIQVLAFVERYNRDPIQRYRDNKVKAFAASYKSLFDKTGKRNPDDNLTFQRDTVANFNLRFEIDNVTFFYDELYVCVDSGICDEETAHKFFGKHALDFTWGLQFYIPLVKEKRERRGVTGYGQGLMYFADAYTKR